MRFTVAWANVMKENLCLKTGVVSLAICALSFAIVAARLALKDPLIVERGCQSKVGQLGGNKRSSEEIESFIKLAIKARFDSDSPGARLYLSPQSLRNREAEQRELQKKNVRQTVIVDSVKIDKERIEVQLDRLLRVGPIRSALPFRVEAKLSRIVRTESNPYGLNLESVTPLKKKGAK